MPGPGTDLGPAPLATANLNDQLDVGVFSGRIAAGGQGLDLSEQRADDVHHPRKAGSGKLSVRRVGRALVADASNCTELSARNGLLLACDSGMESQREVGNHHRAGLRPAQSDLVIRFGIGSRRMDTEDRKSLRRRPPQGLAAERERAAHDGQIDPRRRQGLIQIASDVSVGEVVSGEPGIHSLQMMLRMGREPGGPGPFLGSITQDQDVHRCAVAPLCPIRCHDPIAHAGLVPKLRQD